MSECPHRVELLGSEQEEGGARESGGHMWDLCTTVQGTKANAYTWRG